MGTNGPNERPQVDDSIVQQAIRGDRPALAQIYDTYTRDIYRYIFSKVGNSPDADDLTARADRVAVRNVEDRSHEQSEQRHDHDHEPGRLAARPDSRAVLLEWPPGRAEDSERNRHADNDGDRIRNGDNDRRVTHGHHPP